MQCFGFYDMLPSDVTSATLRAKIGAASAGHEAALEVIHSKFVQHVALASVAPLTENPKDAVCLTKEMQILATGANTDWIQRVQFDRGGYIREI